MLSIVVVLIYIPTNNVEVFLSPTSSPAFVIVYVIDDSHFNSLKKSKVTCLSIQVEARPIS
jgi:hypothetical protein